jgi:putative transcriptional regulator
MLVMKLGLGAKTGDRTYLDGQCLIAMPGMRDERFQRTVVYICAHSDEGAMGLVINRSAPELQFDDLLIQLGIATDEKAIRINRGGLPSHVLRGGPVETGRGFVLHSSDYYTADATLPIDDGVCLTHTVDILKAIATGSGPHRAVLALGYAGWSAGQLESEIKANGWLHCPADPGLLFDETIDTKYQRALSKLGVDIGALSVAAGHA